MADQLATIIDFIRWGASRFQAAGLTFGHSYDNALDEATQLVLHALHLPHDLAPAYGQARLTAEERATVFNLFRRRLEERKPAAYLTGEAWFAGLAFKVDERVLVPRSPIAELIEAGFQPWLAEREVERAIDLCTGSGCIGIAMAVHQPHWRVDVTDVSAGERDDLVVSNPPYVPDHEVDALPAEYGHEPALGLRGGADGLDLALRLLADAPQHMTEHGLMVLEVGDSEAALSALLPQLPLAWVEFKVGQMGVCVAERADLVQHHAAIRAELARRGL